MKKFYALLCVLGLVLPYWQFFLWIADNGFEINALISEIIDSRISAFAWLDVILILLFDTK